MTYEDAKRIRANPEEQFLKDECFYKLSALIDVAIEKQIPKNPVEREYENLCPECSCIVSEEVQVTPCPPMKLSISYCYEFDFCPNCGQRINKSHRHIVSNEHWGDTNDSSGSNQQAETY